MQSVDTKARMADASCFNVEITGPAHALIIANRACRGALGERGVAHVTVAKDAQARLLSADKPSTENHGARTSDAWMPLADAPAQGQLRVAADILNGGSRVAIPPGQGCTARTQRSARSSRKTGAPMAKALLCKAVIPDDSPDCTGGIGHLGTQASEWAMHRCDTLLILGSTMPWLDSYPDPGAARGVQIDLKADRIGLRYPVDVGLVGDVRETLAVLLPMLKSKADHTFLTDAQGAASGLECVARARRIHGTLASAAADGHLGAERRIAR